MPSPDDSGPRGSDDVPTDAPDDVPTVSCARCGRTWDLSYELDDLAVGNQSFEQFALDHARHTGHYPDGVTPWVADCRQCPDGDRFLSEHAAARWAETHARHTRHSVAVSHAEEERVVDP